MASSRTPAEAMQDTHLDWYPIAASSDLVPRHVFHGQLWGQELAVWRADDGHVNVWENRCLHRGVRLTIGSNLGHELMCQYHGWRYANRTAGCTYIPAHPAEAPARTVCNRTYPMIERRGLIWTSLDREIESDMLPDIDSEDIQLRAVEVQAPDDVVEKALPKDPDFTCFLQPVDAGITIVRGFIKPGTTMRAEDWDHKLCLLRDRLEETASSSPSPIPHRIEPVATELATMPDRAARGAALRVTVARKWTVARDVMAFRLEPASGTLPAFQPGAHLDVHLPNGLIRQYSITNGPQEVTNYTIAVKREDAGDGGSRTLHQDIKEGDLLAISEPRNNFPLRRDQLNVKFIAGGIGITPLLSMARTLQAGGFPFEFHIFTQSEDHIAFKDHLTGFGSKLHRHLGLDPQQSGDRFRKIIGIQGEKETLYVCGPPLMLDAVRLAASDLGWAEEDVRFEYFQNETGDGENTSFEVALARSALTIEVAADQSIAEACRSRGIMIPTSCEKGACGTCQTTVIDGEIDHRDVFLTEKEKAKGDRMLCCVSRAVSKRLVLDL